MIITFANHKGGVGKTSLAVAVAEWAVETGLPVKLYDIDPQQDFNYAMQQWTKNPGVSSKLPEKLPDDKLVIIDTPPGMGAETERAIRIADKVVVPIDTKPAAIKGIAGVVGNCKNKPIVVLNRFRKGYSFNENMRTYIQKLTSSEAVLVELPECNMFAFNVAEGSDWLYRMSKKTAKPFLDFIHLLFIENLERRGGKK